MLTNSIIAGNSARVARPDICGAITSSNGHNIFGSDVEGNSLATWRTSGGSAVRRWAGRQRRSDADHRAARRRRQPGAGRRRSGRRARHRPARRGAAAAGWHRPRHRRVRAEPDGVGPSSTDRRHRARRVPEWHGRCRPDARAGRRRPAVGLGRRRRALRRLRERCAGRQAGHRPDDRAAPAPTGSSFASPRRRSAGWPGLRRDPRLPRGAARPDRPAPDRRQHRRGRRPDVRLHRRQAFTEAGQLRFEATADGDFLVSGNVDRDLDAEFAFIVRTERTA